MTKVIWILVVAIGVMRLLIGDTIIGHSYIAASFVIAAIEVKP